MRYAAIDIETDGLDTRTSRIVELGWAIWDSERGVPLSVQSHLVLGGPIPASAQAIHGITDEDVEIGGREVGDALARLDHDLYVWGAERVVGHNHVAFDLPIIARYAHGVHKLFELKTLDTRTDIPGVSGRLIHVLAEHGRINPFQHRACFDALSCCLILDAVKDKWPMEKLCARLDAPQALYQSTQPFARNDEAKALGFGWDGDKRWWSQRVPEFEAAELEAKAKAARIDIRRIK